MLEQVRLRLAGLISPELVEQRDQAVRVANIDQLTRIANRRAFDLAQSTFEHDPHTCVILFDADNFGQVNKHQGHGTGDALLVSLAETLRDVAAIYGLASRVFRLGGDEFAILVPCSLAEMIRDRCEQVFGERLIGDAMISVTGTIGRSLSEADRTLQARKTQRKAQHETFSGK